MFCKCSKEKTDSIRVTQQVRCDPVPMELVSGDCLCLSVHLSVGMSEYLLCSGRGQCEGLGGGSQKSLIVKIFAT